MTGDEARQLLYLYAGSEQVWIPTSFSVVTLPEFLVGGVVVAPPIGMATQSIAACHGLPLSACDSESFSSSPALFTHRSVPPFYGVS